MEGEEGGSSAAARRDPPDWACSASPFRGPDTRDAAEFPHRSCWGPRGWRRRVSGLASAAVACAGQMWLERREGNLLGLPHPVPHVPEGGGISGHAQSSPPS